jgi:peptide/nickel transport system ATP-binding protein
VAVRDVTKVFRIRGRGFLSRGADFTAVDGVTLDVPRGSTVAVVGESGSGKSTLARMILDIETPTSGTIEFDGAAVGARGQRERIAYRRRVQPVFQDPYSSLDPLYSVYSPSRSRSARGCCGASPPSSRAASASAWRSPGRWPSSPSW